MIASANRHADTGTRPTGFRSGTPSQGDDRPDRLRFAIHGAVVEVENFLPGLEPYVRRLLGSFAVPDWPEGFMPVHGTIRPYEQSEVLRHLSPAARPLPRTDDLAAVFQDGERFWMVDERWGMAEINFLKGQWRSWVLPRPQFEPARCAEMAVLWPLAQLLRPRGVYLLPAAAAVRENWAFLLICPFGVGPELSALLRSGYKIIGRRWTAVREEDGRPALLHMPGLVEGQSGNQSRAPAGAADGGAAGERAGAVDPTDTPNDAWQNHAFCDAVLIADAVRRPRASVKELDPAAAAGLLRSAWPIVELHPSRRHSPLPGKLAQLCRCAELQLSRDPAELLPLLDTLRRRARAVAA